MKIIAVTGPESSGKTTFCRVLQHLTQGVVIPEYSRVYLRNKKEYDLQDLEVMAQGQMENLRKIMEANPKTIICDTDMTVMTIWCDERFGLVPDSIQALCNDEHYDLLFLCAPDIPWEADPLRENPDDRDRLFEVYKEKLTTSGKRHVVINGSELDREKTARKALLQVGLL
ncbi:MAG: ATP-binding protein [Flavobacteriales bacterium]|nr:ATP-binding protein [Flavobacteriales bacterium]